MAFLIYLEIDSEKVNNIYDNSRHFIYFYYLTININKQLEYQILLLYPKYKPTHPGLESQKSVKHQSPSSIGIIDIHNAECLKYLPKVYNRSSV